MGACQYCKNLAITFSFFFLITPLTAQLTFNFEQFPPNLENLTFEGDVHQEKSVLQLTRNKKDSVGRVRYCKNMHLWDRESRKVTDFTTHFSFIINAPNKTSVGDGITFFMASPKFPLPDPPDGSGIGLVSRPQMRDPNYPEKHPFVAVEFDTSYNYWDPKYDHVGINVKSMSTNYTTEWFSVKDGRKYDAEISYNSSSLNLSVIFTGYKDDVRVKQGYSHVVDLRTVLPDRVEFGFSSATGLSYDEIHTICSWSFSSNLDLQIQKPKPKDKSKSRVVMWVSIGAGVLVCIMCLTLLVIWKMRRRRPRDGLNFELTMDNDFERGAGPKKFSYDELVRATDNFSEVQKLGEGGFGGVFKGFMRDSNTYVAIKKVSKDSRQGVKEYASEVKIISQLRHRNLVQLLGWCHQNNDLLLIYEFMPNGSLDYHLFKSKRLLTWETRYNIAGGLASAILYLHEEWEQCVVHRDIKSSNIMLDSNFNAKLGDFGLARMVDHGKGSQTTILAGTIGYLAPESATRGKTSRESDVYSFGVVALEIVCGRKPIDPHVKEEQVVMVEWVWELYGMGKLLEAADPRLCGDFNEQEMERLMIVGLWCAHPDYTQRPTIRQAIHVLNFEAALPNLPLKVPPPSSFSSSSSVSFGAAGINQTQVSSNSSSYTTSGSSQSATSALLPPSPTALPHTY